MIRAIKYLFYISTILLISGWTLVSCQSEDSLAEEHTESDVVFFVPDKVLEDANTRASYSLVGGSKMVYSWDTNDQIGVFNVSQIENSTNMEFTYKPNSSLVKDNGVYARFSNDDFSFEPYFWVAYAPYTCYDDGGNRKKILKYNDIKLTYSGQRQTVNAVPNGQHPKEDKDYTDDSEKAACQYLVNYDYLISAPTKPEEGSKMTFPFQHLGSTVRFFIQFPEGGFGGGTGYVKGMRIVSKAGTPFKSDVELTLKHCTKADDSSFEVKSTTPSNEQYLNLTNDEGQGIAVPDNGYLISYMEFYPCTVADKTCFLYLTVDVNGVEKNFRSELLPAKTIVAGKLYQWKPTAFDTPIELTATLATWQEIIAEDIDVNLEN